MQKIVYRGGVVTFEIPEDWLEDEDEEDGSGLFYEDEDDSGLLRLHVITASNPNPVTPDMLTEILNQTSTAKNRKLDTLPNGNVLMSYTTTTRQTGQLLVIYFWLVGTLLPPHHARIANFSYTVLAVNATSNKTQSTVAQLEKSIRNAEFARELGEPEALPPGSAAQEE